MSYCHNLSNSNLNFSMAGTTTRTYLTLKALIAIIFCLIGLQYLSLLQVSEKQRRPGNSRNLFYFERGGDADSKNGRRGGILESISHLLEPSKILGLSSELESSTTITHRISSNASQNSAGKICTKSEISFKSTSSGNKTNIDQECLCPMIPPGEYCIIDSCLILVLRYRKSTI